MVLAFSLAELFFSPDCSGWAMEKSVKTKTNEPRFLGGEVRISIGLRLYELFCADCNRVLIEEDSRLMRLQCTECKRIYAYRLSPDQEESIFELSTKKVSIQ
jgi:phage FluMu protein Com